MIYKNLHHKFLALSLATVLMSILYSCDSLDGDVKPENGGVDISNTEAYVVSNGSTYIDLRSMIKTSDKVKLDITSQPNKGNLTEMGTGLLRYAPFSTIKRGRDSFTFSIYNNGRLLLSDSVVIIVENDTTELPCGIYPQNDYVYMSAAGTLQVNVLANDRICGDSANLVVEIYRPNNSFLPHHGSATVSGSVVKYTANTTFVDGDSFLYKVYSKTDTTYVGFGEVIVRKKQACSLKVLDDYFRFKKDSIVYDTLHLTIFKNDNRCDSLDNNSSVNILRQPKHGNLLSKPYGIDYILKSPLEGTLSDSLVYEVCVLQQCRSGVVKIEIK